MKSYPLIAAKVTREIWSITPGVFDAICAALNSRGEASPFQSPLPPQLPEDDSNDGYAVGSTAVIPVFGILGKHLSQMEMLCGGASYDLISAQLKAAAENPEVARIVMPFNSPGGMCQGMDECADLISKITAIKPVIAFTDGDCCSAALRLASACTAFYATPSADVGSVGCYCLYLDESAALEKAGVKVNAISSGEFKMAGASFKPMSEPERAMLQARVDSIGESFRAALTSRRAIAAEDLQGQVFSGLVATSKGFTDGLVSDFDECVEMVEKFQS